ncbi:hypothetical protein [Pantoea stewartii]|uniref:hypothetical protein n=1 Tax=Pantoea stewartii TaxID=66269 RepID=UPI0025A0CB65|nr:hypothetical protein [Pantoea stewartii]
MYNNLNALMDTVLWVGRHHENGYEDLTLDRIVSELSAYNAAIDRLTKMWNEGLTDIEEKLRPHKKKSVKDVAFQSVPTVLGMIVSPGVSSFTTGALALLQNVFGLTQDTREVKSHPSYFLMKINDNRQ